MLLSHLEQNSEPVAIEEGLKYGSGDRHWLDVYLPHAITKQLLPITVFFQGDIIFLPPFRHHQ